MNTDVEHKRLSLWQDYLLDSFKGKNTCVQRCDPCHSSSPARLARPSHRRLQCACRHYFLPRQASVCKPFYQPVVNAGGHPAYFRQRMRLSRRARALSRGVISEQMVGAGVCEWTSPDRTRAFIWWKSPDEWANELHKYALRTGEAEVVETVAYFESEAGSPVLGMQEEVILRVCHTVPPPFFSLDTAVISRLCLANATHVFAAGQQEQGNHHRCRLR